MFGDSSREFSFIELSDLPFLFFFSMAKPTNFHGAFRSCLKRKGQENGHSPFLSFVMFLQLFFGNIMSILGVFLGDHNNLIRLFLYLFCLGAFS